ncbi:MFS multidrug transporter, partial [Aspergillus sp. HF37]
MFSVAKFLYQKARGFQPQNPKPTCRHRRLQRPTSEDAESRPSQTSSANGRDSESQPIQPQGDDRCLICQKERDARTYRWKLICGLALPDILTFLDLTIVATATPYISSHFNKLDELNWIVTAYTLTSTAFIPAFGQLADVFGRHAVLQLAVFLTLVGSTLCAAAQTWGMLLLGRALQGTGSAGTMNVVMIILADKVSLKENAKNNSIFAFISGVGYAVGPEIGGHLTLQIALLSHILLYVLLRNDLIEGTLFRKGSRATSIPPALATLDIIGTILFIFGVGLIILGTAWGGATYAWSARQVVVPIVVGGVCFFLFFVYEYLIEPGRVFARVFPRQSPMLPFSIFARWDMVWLAILEFAAGAAMYSVFYFVGIYFTMVEGYPASKAGVQLLYYIPGLGIGVYAAVYLCNVRPAQTFYPLNLGTILETAGLAALTWATSARNTAVVNGILILAGAGTGIRIMPCALHVSGVWPERLAAAMSLMRFALPFGGTLCLTIMGSVFSNKFSALQSGSGGAGIDPAAANPHSLSSIADLSPAAKSAVRDTAKEAVMWAFISIMPVLGVSLVTGFFLGNVWIKPSNGRARIGDEDEKEEEIASSEVVHVPYLWAMFKGVNKYKRTSKPLTASERQEQAEADLEMRQ